jgi:hypothetical protein
VDSGPYTTFVVVSPLIIGINLSFLASQQPVWWPA